jgi:16S rRNA (guanine966-N2)-methyltransferase
MRIIAGEFRSRRLISPEGLTTRPIPDRVKESVFGMLGERVKNASFLDAFAGSGSIGLEALSRGAASCVFVEQDKKSAAVLQQNIDMLKCADRAQVVIGDALGLSLLARCPRPLDVAFFDPPYPLIEQLPGWERVQGQLSRLGSIAARDGFIIVRTPWPFNVEIPAPVPESAPTRLPRSFKPSRGKGSGGRGRKDDVEYWQGIPIQKEPKEMRQHLHETGQDDLDDGVNVHGPEPALGLEKRPGELRIEGLRGPETHAYGSTAVHWYMSATPA